MLGILIAGSNEIKGVPPQIGPTPGMPERKAVARHRTRVRAILGHTPGQGATSHPQKP